MKLKTSSRYALGSSLALCLAVPAYAQTQPAPATQDAAAPADDGGLATIVVTAQRKSESLQKAALPVDVISGEDFASKGLTSLNQLQQISPALNISSAGGANSTYFIRGVGNFNTNAYSDPAASLNYDGVYIGHSSGATALFYDLDSVEVLKGPQGTLYGRNATAGAINVIPVKPKIGQFSVKASASYGNYNALNLEGAINVPVGDRAALRLSGTHSEHDGYLTDGTDDQNVSGLRGQFLFRPNDDLSIRFTMDAERVRGKGGGSTYDAIVTPTSLNNMATVPSGLANNVGLLDPRAQAFRQAQISGQAGGLNLPPLPTGVYQHNDYIAGMIDIEYRTPIGTVSLIPAYRHAKVDTVHDSAGFPIWAQEKYDQASIEARLGGSAGSFDYILGAYYFDEKVNAYDTIDQYTLAVYQPFRTSTKSAAAFGRLTWHITDALRLTGGYRYTHESKSMNGRATTYVSFGGGFFPFAPITAQVNRGAVFDASIVASPSVSKSTFRAALEYDLTPQVLAYASVETGFHGGGFSLAPGFETYQPETITAYTLGLKSRFLDNRLQLNLEAFDWEYKNQQVAHFGINGSGFPDFFTQNVGSSKIKGVDADLQFRATPNTLLHASVQYLDSKFDNFSYALPAFAGIPVTGCSSSLSGANYIVNCSGLQGYNSPKWTIGLGVVQTIPLSNDWKIELSADTQYRSARMVGFEYLTSELAPADWRSNAAITLSNERWSIGAFIRNISDNRAISSSVYYGTGALVVNRHEDPRTFGVRLTAKL